MDPRPFCFSPLREPDREDRAPELVDLCFGVMARMKAHFIRRTAEFDLTVSQAQALLLVEADRALPLREIAASIGVDPSNFTAIVDRLEARRLVERRPSPRDRRVKTLALTTAGEDLRARLYARALEGVPPVEALTVAEQRRLEELLAKIVDAAGPTDDVDLSQFAA